MSVVAGLLSTMMVQIILTWQYNHRLPRTPKVRAGAKERAGFIEAPDVNARMKISNLMIPPMASPLYSRNPFDIDDHHYYRH